MKFNVILIDDSPLQLKITSKLIKNNPNLNLIGAYSDPFLGLHAVNNSAVDLVFLDIEMPQIDGFSLQRLFKKDAKIVMNSTKKSYEALAFYNGASDFLYKPITSNTLSSSIDRLIKDTRANTIEENSFTTVTRWIESFFQKLNISLQS